MRIHPEGVAVFVEVPKTGSTAASLYLGKHGWIQNGSKGTAPLPGTLTGRHAYPTAETKAFCDEHGATIYGVCRNPWDRMASLWRSSAPGSMSFSDFLTDFHFVHSGMDLMQANQWMWLEHAHIVLRYEQLAQQWDAVAAAVGHVPKGPIPRANVSVSRRVPNWTSAELDVVGQRFIADIDHFGYTGPT